MRLRAPCRKSKGKAKKGASSSDDEEEDEEEEADSEGDAGAEERRKASWASGGATDESAGNVSPKTRKSGKGKRRRVGSR